jgi:hypothetical protein
MNIDYDALFVINETTGHIGDIMSVNLDIIYILNPILCAN